jgi:gliding motility-associated-like protein
VTIKVFAKYVGGCDGNTFTINQTIYKLGAGFTYVTPQCVNAPVVFTDASTGKVSNATVDTKWKWSFGDAANSTATTMNATFAYTTAGTFNVKLRTSLFNIGGAEFCADSITKQIVIQDKLAKPVVALNPALTTGTSLTFNWPAITNASSYQVSNNTGATWNSPSSGASGTTHTVTGLTTNTVYDLCVQALGTCPSDTACAEGKTILPTTDFFVPTAFTPNGQGPNEKLVICGNNVKSIRFIVFTQWGEKIYETTNPVLNTNGCYETWDGNAFGKPQPVGVYVYVASITLNDGSVQNKKGLFSLIR